MRQILPYAMIATLTLAAVLPGAARADEAAAFDALAELPPARVMCVGDAMQPEMLRFAFQAEPEGSGRPEVVRTTARRNAQTRQAAPRPARQVQAGLPTLWLPCIRG